MVKKKKNWSIYKKKGGMIYYLSWGHIGNIKSKGNGFVVVSCIIVNLVGGFSIKRRGW